MPIVTIGLALRARATRETDESEKRPATGRRHGATRNGYPMRSVVADVNR